MKEDGRHGYIAGSDCQRCPELEHELREKEAACQILERELAAKRAWPELTSFLTAIINVEWDCILPNGARLQASAANLLESIAAMSAPTVTAPGEDSIIAHGQPIPPPASV